MKEIIPAVLVKNFNDFAEQTKKLSENFNKIQIDVMDGKFVGNKSFEEIEKINELNLPISWELHLMVKNPLQELEKWTEVKNIFRVIFHIESGGEVMKTINFIKGKCWQAGLAINPETPIDKITPYLPHISEVLFMTVHPGRQGAEFEQKVLKKIEDFSKIPEHPLVAVDGGIDSENIKEVSDVGVEIFNIGSDLTMAKDQKQEYQKLKKLLNE